MAEVTLISFFIVAFVSLLTIVNPLSTTSVFLTITAGDSEKRRKNMAKRAAFVGAIILIVFALIGTYILSFFSITIDAFRIAGGILIAGVGLRMVRAKRRHLKTKKEESEAKRKEDISIIPLAIPMTAGPGSMTTAIALMSESSSLQQSSLVILAIIVVSIITYFVLSRSTYIAKKLGETGQKVSERIMGLIVMVVGVQFIVNGVYGVLLSWGMF